MSTATIPTARLLTAEEFAQLPDPSDGSQQELVNGVIITMPPARGPHGSCCLTIGSSIFMHVKANKLGRVFSNDTGFILQRDPDTVRGPDVAFWKTERLPEVPVEEYISVPPDLAIEVLSPSDRPLQLQNKVTSYQECGVALIWVVDPIDRAVGVYRLGRAAQILTENDTLNGEDILPGFTLPVRELFA